MHPTCISSHVDGTAVRGVGLKIVFTQVVKRRVVTVVMNRKDEK